LCVDAWKTKRRLAAPEAHPGLKTSDGAQVFQTARERNIAHARFGAVLGTSTDAPAGRELCRVERCHQVSAVAEALPEGTVDAGSRVEPRRRNDEGVDEGALDSVKYGRLVSLVDDPNGHEQHAGSEVERGSEQEVQISLFELELTALLETFYKRMFD